VDEALRVLDALRAGAPCAHSWALGDGTIDPARTPGPGLLLGHYRLQARLGEGGFGLVLKAWDLWLHRVVALKVLRPGRKLDRERVLAEARPAARLNHPNICTLYSVEIHDGYPLIAMEYLSGVTLWAKLKHGPLEPTEAGPIARDVARGMAASHALGVVHGDLKPGNIMLTDDGQVKILDFGLASVVTPTDEDEEAAIEEAALAEEWAEVDPSPARGHRPGSSRPSARMHGAPSSRPPPRMHGSASSRPPPHAHGAPSWSPPPSTPHAQMLLRPLANGRPSQPYQESVRPSGRLTIPPPPPTSPRNPVRLPVMFRGTPPYMSPEHGSKNGPTGASDVYSFGLVMFEMLSGHRALPETTLRSAMRKVRNQDLAPLARALPRPFRALVEACLSRDPADRPTMAALEHELSSF
jgi:serine/threonine protein kinase